MDTIHQFEIIINIFFQNLGNWLVLPMKLFSAMGEEQFFLLFLPAIYWCISASWGIRMGFMLISATSLHSWLKLVFAQPRPYWIDPRVKGLVDEASFGLPSGHATSSAGLFGLVTRIIKKSWFTILAIIIVFMVGLSRIALGAHFTTDVLAGWLLGGLLVWAFVRFDKPVSSWITRMGMGSQLLVAISSSLLMLIITFALTALRSSFVIPAEWLANSPTINPLDPTGMVSLAGTWLGLTTSAIWWNHRSGPLTGAKTWKLNVIRYLVGVAGLFIIWYGLGAIFPRTLDLLAYTLRYIRYAIVGGWVGLAAPLIFMKLKV